MYSTFLFFQKQSPWVVLFLRCFRRPACNFIKKRLQHRCFPLNFLIFKNTFFEEHLWRLFLSFGIFEDKVSSDVLGPWQTSIMKRFVNTVCSFYLVKVYLNRSTYICVKVFKNEPSKIYGREPLKNFLKSFLPQILLAPFLNTLTHIIY